MNHFFIIYFHKVGEHGDADIKQIPINQIMILNSNCPIPKYINIPPANANTIPIGKNAFNI